MAHSIGSSAALKAAAWSTFLVCLSVQAAPAAAAGAAAAEHARVVAYWTPERIAAAIPRDLVKDLRGQGYLRGPDGTLTPYGRLISDTSAGAKPMAGKPGAGDTTAPTVGNFDPAAAVTIGASYTFSATVVDNVGGSGVRSVTFKIQKAGSTAQSFNASSADGTTWKAALSGLTDGSWTWWVVAKDKAGNTTTTAAVSFSVSTSSGGGGGGGSVVANADWGTTAGKLQTAAGRLYFEMPSNAKRTRWTGYVCSGTVVIDGTGGRSIVLTAAHCVYDDSNKAFARNALFIPDQDETTAAGTDLNCTNDPLGCWTPWFGVVDREYTTRTFPDNDQWDYAYYVVKDTAAHTQGFRSGVSDVLDGATTPMDVNFGSVFVDTPDSSDYTYALGYSYSDDPKFMYCAEDMTTQGAVNWWLPSCGLSGGSSGGPWVQGMTVSGGSTTTEGKVVSVNSWGYTNSPGMAGPKLDSAVSTAACVFSTAKSGNVASGTKDGDAGIAAICP